LKVAALHLKRQTIYTRNRSFFGVIRLRKNLPLEILLN
jgi:hypothetical protein